MKKIFVLNLGTLLLILLTAASSTIAQNYSMVNTGRLSLFSNGWETRGVDIESTAPNGTGGTDFINYPSVEITIDGAKRMTGKGWLGGTVSRSNDVDMVINYLGDTLRFPTTQPAGYSWVFYTDDVDNVTTATIESVQTQNFIGLTDSVKTITFQTTNLGIPAPTWIDDIQVRISKNYGLIEGFNLYEFPTFFSEPQTQYRISHHHKFMVDYNIPDTTYTLIGMETPTANFGEVRLTPEEVFDIPDSLRYTRFNVDYAYGGGDGQTWYRLHDHLVFNQHLTSTLSDIEAHTCIRSWEPFGLVDTSYWVMDTMNITSDYGDVWFEGRPYEYSPSFDGFQVTLHLTTKTGRRLLYIIENYQNPGLDSLVLDNTHHRDGFMDRLGKTYDYYNHSTGSGLDLNQNLDAWYLTYYKIGSEEFIGSTSSSSTYIPYEYDHDCIDQFLPQDSSSTGILELPDRVSLYPNPSKGSFIFESEANQAIRIMDMQGREVQSVNLNSGKNEIVIDRPGIFLLRGEDWTERVVITK